MALAGLMQIGSANAAEPPSIAGVWEGRAAAASPSRCIPAGMPQMMTALQPIEIVEVPGKIVILGQLFGELRHIYLDEKMPPLDELTPTFAGYSVAHWEGSTLVVETRGIREDVQFFHIPHSADMTLTERIRMTARGTLENSIVISDPAVLARPYSMKFEYRRAVDQKSAEYVCDRGRSKVKDGVETHETNRAR
jgi:hypothetical protein